MSSLQGSSGKTKFERIDVLYEFFKRKNSDNYKKIEKRTQTAFFPLKF